MQKNYQTEDNYFNAFCNATKPYKSYLKENAMN